jgi:hypothetical protein
LKTKVITWIERLHSPSEVWLPGLEDDVQVVGHNGESADAPTMANRGFTHVFLEPVAVDVVAYSALTAIAASHEVVDRARVLDA